VDGIIRSGAKGRDFHLHGKAGISQKYLPSSRVLSLQCHFYTAMRELLLTGILCRHHHPTALLFAGNLKFFPTFLVSSVLLL